MPTHVFRLPLPIQSGTEKSLPVQFEYRVKDNIE